MRALDPALAASQDQALRIADYKVYVYDIVATRGDANPETINRIVREDATVTAPFDLTPYVGQVSMTEAVSDFVSGNLVGSSIVFTVIDRNTRFDPVDGSEPNWLRAGNVVRVYEGDGRATLVSESFNGSTPGVAGTYSLSGRDVKDPGLLQVREGTPDGTLLVEGTHYTVDTLNGTITGVGTKWVAATTYYVTYYARIVPVQDWPITFTGTIVGRAGASERDRVGNQTLQVSATDRMASLLKAPITSQAFAQGTTYQAMMTSILEDELGFDSTEFVLGTVGIAQVTTQATTQFVDESGMVSLAKIAFIDGCVPRFRGDGVLVFPSVDTSISPVIAYENENVFSGFSRPFSPLDVINEVEVLGLESTLTKIPQPRQVVATASLTLGFFGGDASIRVRFSDDETQQAENTELEAVSSVLGALIPFGAEEWEPIIDDDGGCRGGRINVAGAFYAPLQSALYATSIAFSTIGDVAPPLGGPTFPVGRVLEAGVQVTTSLVQATIGRGQYNILGDPYEYVFQEIRRVARVANILDVDRRTLTIENHLIDNDTGDEAQTIANRELINVRKRSNTRAATMRHDLRMEPGDKFSLADEREFVVEQITRILSREASQLTASLSLYETTDGVWP